MDSVTDASRDKEAALIVAQDAAKRLLYDEARLGEMSAKRDNRGPRKRPPDGKLREEELLDRDLRE
ncbi:MAG: hypothetical protein ACYSWO_07005 [Planctomycetota bacterium]